MLRQFTKAELLQSMAAQEQVYSPVHWVQANRKSEWHLHDTNGGEDAYCWLVVGCSADAALMSILLNGLIADIGEQFKAIYQKHSIKYPKL